MSLWFMLLNKNKLNLFDRVRSRETNYKREKIMLDFFREGNIFFNCLEKSGKIFTLDRKESM